MTYIGKNYLKVLFFIVEVALVYCIMLRLLPKPSGTTEDKTSVPFLNFLVAKTRQGQSTLSNSHHELPMRPEYSQVSDYLKILFVHVPMTGGSAIETSPLFREERKKLGGHYLGGHHRISDFKDPAFQSYHKFGIVRHPCSRLISVWQYFLKNMGNDEDNAWVAKFFNYTTLISFDAFVDVLFTRGVTFIENESHLQSQVGMIFNDERFGLDQLLVYERWNESIEELGKKIKVDRNVLQSLADPVMDRYVCEDTYTPVTWWKIRTLYAMDYCVLGYSTDMREEDAAPALNLTSRMMNFRYEKCKVQIAEKFTDQIDGFHVTNSSGNIQCAMYTYFEQNPDIKPDRNNDEMLSLWRNAWLSAGWRPKILTEEDAKNHPYYEELRSKFWALPAVNSKSYELACFMRYVAMAAVGGGWMSDYDVLPYRLPACTEPLNDGMYTVYETFVPSLVSGSSQEFIRVANLMADIDWKANLEMFSFSGKPHVSDMFCHVKMVKEKSIRSMHVVIEPHVLFELPFSCNTSNRQFTFNSIPIGLPRMPWAIHYSHHSIRTLHKRNFTHLGEKSVKLDSMKRPDFIKIANNFLQEKCFLPPGK